MPCPAGQRRLVQIHGRSPRSRHLHVRQTNSQKQRNRRRCARRSESKNRQSVPRRGNQPDGARLYPSNAREHPHLSRYGILFALDRSYDSIELKKGRGKNMSASENSENKVGRGEFTQKGAMLATATAAVSSTALSYSRIPGSNDRISIGHIG